MYDSQEIVLEKNQLFLGENALINAHIKIKCNLTDNQSNPSIHQDELFEQVDYRRLWLQMLDNTKVPSGWKNSGFHLTGFIKEKESWCLSSWIWTSAAVARAYSFNNEIDKVKNIADAFVSNQLENGSWIVRYDFSQDEIIPMVAPNDSAYIARNAILVAYEMTNEEQYLNSAKKCADWIIETSRADGIVYIGYDLNSKKWIEKVNIVDIGFTADLFSKLFDITKEEKYYKYLSKFINVYIELFYDSNRKLFATSINEKDKRQGGFFARGQAWALEGLISAYRVLEDPNVKMVIENVINTLIKEQNRDGSWPYNFSKKLMGLDCKGIPIIANSIFEWGSITNNNHMYACAKRAISWCEKNTRLSGAEKGGIFSYSVEGAVVHDLYSSTAFTYASAYAFELITKLRRKT